MGNILNPHVDNARVYHSDPLDQDIDITRDLFVNESGGMSSDISNNMTQLSAAAKMTMKKRKFSYDFKTKNKSFLNLYNNPWVTKAIVWV